MVLLPGTHFPEYRVLWLAKYSNCYHKKRGAYFAPLLITLTVYT